MEDPIGRVLKKTEVIRGHMLIQILLVDINGCLCYLFFVNIAFTGGRWSCFGEDLIPIRRTPDCF